jgi:hypothetical protein
MKGKEGSDLVFQQVWNGFIEYNLFILSTFTSSQYDMARQCLYQKLKIFNGFLQNLACLQARLILDLKFNTHSL